MFQKILRITTVLMFLGGGFSLGYYYVPLQIAGFTIEPGAMRYGVLGAIAAISGFIGVLLAPGITKKVLLTTHWLEQKLYRMTIQEIVGGAIGLIFGLIIATLLGTAISWIPWVWVNGVLKIIVTLLLGYLGVSVGMKKKEDLLSFIPRFGKDKQTKTDTRPAVAYKILDTSVIIDGRIADICKSGFIEGTLIIPGFVLEELRHIADSSDLLKRNRGRRGLDIFNKIRK